MHKWEEAGCKPILRIVCTCTGKAVAAESDSDDDDYSTADGDSPHRPRDLTASSTPIGGPLSGGLTIPATMNDPGALHLFVQIKSLDSQ